MVSLDLGISPLPPRIINLMSNTSNDNHVKDHIVYKISKDNSTSDYEPVGNGNEY